MRSLAVSLYRSCRDDSPELVSLSWQELCEAFEKHIPRDEKDGLAWSPTRHEPAHRAIESAKALSCLVLDLDQREPPLIEGLSHILYTTYSGKWRLVIELTRDLSPLEFPMVWGFAVNALDLPLIDKKAGVLEGVDVNCAEVARLYYMPSHPTAPTFAPVTRVTPGAPLDVDRALVSAVPIPEPRPAAPLAPPIRRQIDEKFDLESYRASTVRIRDEKKRELLRDLLDGKLIPIPSDPERPRDVTLHSAFSLLATCGDTAPTELVALTLLEPILDRMDCAPEGVVYWREKAMYSFNRALERRLKNDERELAAQRNIARLAGRAPAVETTSEPSADDPPDETWRQKLLIRENKNGEPIGFENRGANVELILSNEPDFRGLRFNVLSKAIEVLDGPLASSSMQTLDVELSNWLARSEYAINISRADCAAQLLHAALKSPYDPVREYLEGLKRNCVWDKLPRINDALATYGGANGDSAYISGISRKFFISCVARVLEPGCKVDTMLILHGEQGVGKTKFVEILGNPWAATLKLDISNKDSVLVATGAWLVELAELVSLRRSDIESMKAFLSTRTDMIRLPYAKSVESFPRRSVFIGTTNDDTPLTDPTGNRRFWPVTIQQLKEEELIRDRDQLWAEAVEAFYAGEEWYFKLETDLKMVEREQGAYEEEDTMGEIILGWYLKKAPPRPERVTTQEIMRYAFSLMPDQMNSKTARRIGDSMRRLGCLKRRLRGADRLAWGFEIPAQYRNAQLVEAT